MSQKMRIRLAVVALLVLVLLAIGLAWNNDDSGPQLEPVTTPVTKQTQPAAAPKARVAATRLPEPMRPDLHPEAPEATVQPDDVTPDPPQDKPKAYEVHERDEIGEIVTDLQPLLAECAVSATGPIREYGLVKLVVKFVISGTGEVMSETVVEPKFASEQAEDYNIGDDPDFEDCLLDTFVDLEFSRINDGTGVTIVRYPFHFDFSGQEG